MSGLSDELADTFAEETDADTAQLAAEKIATFADDFDEELTAGSVLDCLEDAPYDEFSHRYNWVVGELAAEIDDCTDSREYRLGGYDELSADPEIGA